MKNVTEMEVDSECLAITLLRKMLAYEQEIDQKDEKTKAEERHIAFLRAMRDAGMLKDETEGL